MKVGPNIISITHYIAGEMIKQNQFLGSEMENMIYTNTKILKENYFGET